LINLKRAILKVNKKKLRKIGAFFICIF